MKINTIMTAAAGLLLSAGITQGQHLWQDPSGWAGGLTANDASSPKFTAQELSLDLFGSYINPEQKFSNLFSTNIRHGSWGGGAGLNYFFTRELGIGTDFNISDMAGNWDVNYVVGNLYLRVPIGNTGLAPYIYGGGGRGINPIWQWVYGGGAGLEFRFSPHLGFFGDGRFLFSDQSTSLNSLTLRAGIRLVF